MSDSRCPQRFLVASCLCASLFATATTAAPALIELTPDMLVNLSGVRPATELADEQDTVGDPLNGHGGKPKTIFSQGWQNKDLYFPLDVVVDLGVELQLTAICWFDANGSAPMTVSVGSPRAWKQVASDDLKAYLQWKTHALEERARYVKFRFETPGALISEIGLYGEPSRAPLASPRKTPPRPPRSTMDRFMGINAFVDDPIERIAAVGIIREYHQWAWDEGNGKAAYSGFPSNQYAWSPSWVSGPGWGWDFDDFYSRLREAGLEISPVLQQSAPYLVGNDFKRISEKPAGKNEDPSAPESYREHADWLFQFAARYGSNAIDPSLLKLRPGQPKKTGLGLIRHLENYNEPDRWWEGRRAHFSPFEFAAMCSADYDGHRGAMGATVGVKNADPQMRFVMGGIARPEPEYLKAMMLWADAFRDGDFPADVINLHHYSNDGGGQHGAAKHGISPEADDLKGRMRKLVGFCHENLPGRGVWLTEFGYDIHPGSYQHAPKIGANDSAEVQAQWLVRSYLELAAAGIDRAFQYMLRDVNAASPTQYNTSGLTSEKANGHQPKKSWHYVATMKSALKGLAFHQEIANADRRVRVYEFRSPTGPERAFAVWCSTSEDLRIPGFGLPVGEENHATLIALAEGDPVGIRTNLPIQDGVVIINVSERPVFVQIQPH